MNKIMSAILIFFLYISPAWGDEAADGLPKTVPQHIRTSTREMVKAGVQKAQAVRITQTMMQHEYRQHNTMRAQQIVMDTLQEGLPADPVMNKAFEGMAKNITENLVIQAMEKTRARYSYAYSHAREFSKNRDKIKNIGNAIAQSLTAGIADRDVERTAERLQERTHEMTPSQTESIAEESFLTLRSVARRGAPSQVATDVVCQALKHQYTAKDMKQIRHSFMRRTTDTDPAKLAHQYAHAIGKGAKAGDMGEHSSGDTAGHGGSSGAGGSGGDGGGSGGGGGGSGGGGGGR